MRVKTFLNKRAAAVLITVMVGFGLTSCGVPAATTGGGPSDSYTAGLYNALNGDRGANGLGGLSWSPQLADLASNWAHQMSNANTLYHQNLGAIINSPGYAAYHTLGENILVGPGSMSPNQVEGTFMSSGAHRANILSGAFNIVGVGYYRGPDGRLWVVQDFGEI